MHRVLLVWEEIPEALSLYDLELDNADFDMLQKCHGKLVNGDMDDPILVEWIMDRVDDTSGVWKGLKVQPKKPLNLIGPITVVVSGLIA